MIHILRSHSKILIKKNFDNYTSDIQNKVVEPITFLELHIIKKAMLNETCNFFVHDCVQNTCNNSSLLMIALTDGEVEDGLFNLNLIKDCGPDGMRKSLTILINLSLRSCCFPQIWKDARFIPIYKRDRMNTVENLRP